MSQHKFIAITLMIIFLITIPATGQIDLCTSLVDEAMTITTNACHNPGRNAICYGHGLIFLQAQPNASVVFESAGDVAPISDVARLTLTPLDPTTDMWGISLMCLQANMQGTSPGQLVNIIVFGNVEVQDIEGGAFHFQSGVGRSECAQAPDSGIMVRTPAGVAEINLNINEVDIRVGSTAFIEANIDTGMNITMLDGNVEVAALGNVESAQFTQTINVPMMLDNGSLIPAEPPSQAQSWDAEKVSRLFVVYDALNEIESYGHMPAHNEPCVIHATTASTAELRVGPGEHRTRRAFLDTDLYVDVTGKKVVDNRIWWQVDKYQAYPSGADMVMELWVPEDQVVEQGACEQVVDVDAPPIIKPPPTPAPRQTAVPQTDFIAPPQTHFQDPIVSLTVDDSSLSSYEECTKARVYVEYIDKAYFDGPGRVKDRSVEGPVWSTKICPPSKSGNYTYTLDVYDEAGNFAQWFVTVTRYSY